MNIRTLSAVLLVGQILSVGFIFRVLQLQYGLFKTRIQSDLLLVRRTLFFLALVILLGNVIPLMLDIFTVFDNLRRGVSTVNLAGIFYTISNTLTLTVSAILIWQLYRMAAKVLIVVEHDKDVALEDAKG